MLLYIYDGLKNYFVILLTDKYIFHRYPDQGLYVVKEHEFTIKSLEPVCSLFRTCSSLFCTSKVQYKYRNKIIFDFSKKTYVLRSFEHEIKISEIGLSVCMLLALSFVSNYTILQ